MADTAPVPRLRFPGFSALWTYEPLAKVLKEHKVKNTDGRDVFSVSMEYGIVNQIELLGRSFAAADTSHYTIGRRYDIVYTKSPLKAFPFGIVKQCKFDGEAALSPLYGVFTPTNPHLGSMIEAFFELPSRSMEFLSPLCQKGAKNTLQITNATFLSGRLPLPADPAEQQKIADCLGSADELIAAQGKKVDALRLHKQGLLRRLFPRDGKAVPVQRFPHFRGAGQWKRNTVEELTVSVTPPKKLQTSEYQRKGDFPIIDQSPDAACGWTDDTNAVVDEGLPVVVFGDHTCTLKLVHHPFAQGADGIKILRPRPGIDAHFLFHAIEADPVAQDGYKRHFSVLRQKRLFYPDLNSGEQQLVASCVSSLSDLIAAETEKLDALKTHKKALMQQLFPSMEAEK